jgi:putative colanic acid biosynthesis acetyltransferase WcaF
MDDPHQKTVHLQTSRFHSPYTLRYRIKILLWLFIQSTIFITPKPFKSWRIFLLRCFGAQIQGSPFVSGWCRIKMPWHLKLEDRCCIGPHAEIYNLAHVTLKKNAVLAQHAYLCAGSHDFEDKNFPLITAPIIIGEGAFIGAKAIILMGVEIGDHAVIGAGAVVAKSIPKKARAIGNPCQILEQKPE